MQIFQNIDLPKLNSTRSCDYLVHKVLSLPEIFHLAEFSFYNCQEEYDQNS